MKKKTRRILVMLFIVLCIFIYKLSSNEEVLKMAREIGKDNLPPEVTSTMDLVFDALSKDEDPPEPIAESIIDFGEFTEGTVLRVVDGDTFELTTGEKVRIIGVNTPESTTRTEPYGLEASDFAKEMLTGRRVYLQKDVSDRDRYGRLLRYVWFEVPQEMTKDTVASHMFNAHLIIEGYGQPYTLQPDSLYAELFVDFARDARENEKGLWSIDPKGTTKGTDF